MTYGSLFSGIGGIDIGMDRAGFFCRWQVEIDPFCAKVLEKHWPGVKRHGDIRTLTGDELEPVDLICGGYPCQPFSQAGKRAGTADERHLWPEFARIAGVLRPRYLLLENVPGHLSLGFGDVLRDLAGLGYDAEWCCLRASDFGASHLRKRVFIVAYRVGERVERRRDAGIMGASASSEPGEAHQWERHGSSVDNRGNAVADSTSAMANTGHGTFNLGARHAGQHIMSPADDSGTGGTLADSPRNGQPGRLGEAGRSGARGVWEAGEPLEFIWHWICTRCRQSWEAVKSGTGIIAAVPCPGCGADESPDSRILTCELVGHADDTGPQGRSLSGCGRADELSAGQGGDTLADADREHGDDQGHGTGPLRPQRSEPPEVCGRNTLADPNAGRQQGPDLSVRSARQDEAAVVARGNSDGLPDFAPGPADPRWPAILRERPDLAPALESQICRMADGLPEGMDRAMSQRTKRLKALGNAVVPDCVEWIARKIIEFEERL